MCSRYVHCQSSLNNHSHGGMQLTHLKRLENNKKSQNDCLQKIYRLESRIMLLSTKVKTCRKREMIMGCTVVHC